MNSKTTISAVKAATSRSACGSGIGSCTALGTNSSTTPASSTSEPMTASLPSVLVSHALALAETWPRGPRFTVMEYQSRNSEPITAASVPPTTIHWLRETCDQSIVTLLGKTTSEKPALVRRIGGESSSTLQGDEERGKERDALPQRLERDALVDRMCARPGRAEAVDHGRADRRGEVPVRAARRRVLGQVDTALARDRDRRADELGRARRLHHGRPRDAARDRDRGAVEVRPQATDRRLERALVVHGPRAGVY